MECANIFFVVIYGRNMIVNIPYCMPTHEPLVVCLFNILSLKETWFHVQPYYTLVITQVHDQIKDTVMSKQPFTRFN